ncbi:LINE-1 reverse transcriptase like, partial [Trifolium medium]|nr:LINE-1 reverse transcriptase like [Trifolium medium]
DISDHCPIWLDASKDNWGPKPFRVINGWLEHPDFISFVENAWKGFDVHGSKTYILKEKFKLLKECLKKWNREVFGILDLEIEKTVKDINDFEGMMDGDEDDDELIRRKGLNSEFWRQLHLKEGLLHQKSRTRWIKEGDSNSRYFHQVIKGRRRRNQLVALQNGDQWIQGVTEVKGFVKNYFMNNFTEQWDNRPNFDGIQFQTLSDDDNFSLIAPFSIIEVREAIWSSDGNKCPGPDGFNFNFIKACWEIIKGDIMDFLHEFHGSAHLPKAITASFLTLIPKNDHPQALSDYRPICLVSSLYKILSKVLATRLKNVLGKVISKVQSAFLPNRQILDGVLVVNELLDLAKRRKDKCMFFKIDFERAYDTVNWNFLDYMLGRMGFVEVWWRWIRACVFQSFMSVLVNGSPTEDFVVGKGLRQGDPLSPFLFLIVAEGLTGLMCKAVDNGFFQGYKVCNDILFHTLQFADDTIIVGEGNWDNLWSIKIVLRSFELVTGLKVNFFKSKLYGVNLDDNFLRASSDFLHCGVDSIPFRFLGIPVGANPRRKATWLPIIDKMKKRLSSWNGRHLSIGGRVTLINSVLSSLPLYFFSFFKAPACVIQDLNILKKSSIWWRDIWRIGGGGEGNWFGNNTSCKLGDGNNIGFWKENWCGTDAFCDLFPSLYSISAQKEEAISAMGYWEVHGWRWRLLWSYDLNETDAVCANELHAILDQVQPQRDAKDRRRWTPNDAGLFTVKSAYMVLQNRYEMNNLDPNVLVAVKRLWLNNVPSKVSIFGWRLLLERLPTREALHKRGIITSTNDALCVYCSMDVEDQKGSPYYLASNNVEYMAKAKQHLISREGRDTNVIYTDWCNRPLECLQNI